MAKEMGDIVRYERAPQPKWAAMLVVALAGVVVVNAMMFVFGVAVGWNEPTDDFAGEHAGAIQVVNYTYQTMVVGNASAVNPYEEDPISQVDLGLWLGNVFFGMALILMLYRRFFMDDVMVVKKRHPKYEDFLEKYDIE